MIGGEKLKLSIVTWLSPADHAAGTIRQASVAHSAADLPQRKDTGPILNGAGLQGIGMKLSFT